MNTFHVTYLSPCDKDKNDTDLSTNGERKKTFVGLQKKPRFDGRSDLVNKVTCSSRRNIHIIYHH